MKIRTPLLVVRVLAAALLVVFAMSGCESDDSPDTGGVNSYFSTNPISTDLGTVQNTRGLTITPASVTITFVGQQQTFTASGGGGSYSWNVSDLNSGSVQTLPDTRNGLYTAAVVGPNSVVVYDNTGKAGLATVTGPSTALVAVANPDTITQVGGRAILTATGGTPPYNWTVADIALGTLEGGSPQQGNSVVYIASTVGTGDNTVSCTDAAGQTVNVLIKQQI